MRNNLGQFVKGTAPDNKGISKYDKYTKDWFDKNYYKPVKSLSQLSREENTYNTSLARQIRKLGLHIIPKTILQSGERNPFFGKKHTLVTKEKLRGDRPQTVGAKNHNWKGGYEPYYGEDWKKQRRLARKRANYHCERCDKEQKGRELDVHHIIRYKISKDNSLPNLIALCVKCHRKAPEHWEQLYTKMI